MNVIILGPPGAGKGTQAKIVADRFGLAHLSTGDLLRNAVREGSDLGRKAKSYMNQGTLVPDAIVVDLIRRVLPKTGGFILDGFPRTTEQAQALDQMLEKEGRKIDAVINLEVGDDEVISRLSGRRQCPNGHVFNVHSNPSTKGDLCDVCSEKLLTRKDDVETTVRQRLAVYKEETAPLIDFYRKRGKLRSVPGGDEAASVTSRVEREIGAST